MRGKEFQDGRPLASPLAALVRPAPVVATAVLLANDHWLKGAGVVPAVITGKLSDFAGLFLLPVLVSASACALLRRYARGAPAPGFELRLSAAIAVAIAAAFAALKTWPACNRLVADVWGANALDPGDLLALPMAGLAWLWLRRNESRARSPERRTTSAQRRGHLIRTLAVAAAALACLATAPPRYPRNYPMWRVGSGYQPHGCALVAAVVTKSGKAGAGLTLVARGQSQDRCSVRVARAVLRLTGGTPGGPPLAVVAVPVQRTDQVEVTAGSAEHIYLPFLFDNNDMWNRQIRRGVFEIDLVVDGRSLPTWRIPAEHHLDGFHRDRWDDMQDPARRPPRHMAQ